MLFTGRELGTDMVVLCVAGTAILLVINKMQATCLRSLGHAKRPVRGNMNEI